MRKDKDFSTLNGLSYIKGSTDTPLSFCTIPSMFKDIVKKYGKKDAAIFCAENKRFSYNSLSKHVDAFATGLLKLGVNKGNRVGIWSPNRSEWLITQFATARIGAVLVNINPAYRPYELEHALKLVGCKTLVTAANFKTSDYISMLQKMIPELELGSNNVFKSQKLPKLKNIIRMGDEKTKGMYNFDDICKLDTIDTKALNIIDAMLDPDDAINIQFTSGTTGTPKGACLTHYNIVNNGYFVTETIEFTHLDRLCLPVPLYHCFGMVMGVLGSFTHGAALIFPSEAFDAGQTLKALEAEKCTALYAVPTMFIAMFEHERFKTTNLSGMRRGVMAGALCPIEVMRRAIDEMNMDQITICYGMTETSPVSFQTLTDTPIQQRCQTVGKVHPHVEVKIVDENGAIVKHGEKGELCTRGYSVMLGYWADEAKTSETIDAKKWLHTGDLATLDTDGYCRIVGRIKDMIIRGGENIYPREIEDYLFLHDDILQVQVFGVKSVKYGEEVAAFIILKKNANINAEDVRNFCDQQISHYKIPKYIKFVDDWPATVTGKPQKFLMKEILEKHLGLDVA